MPETEREFSHRGIAVELQTNADGASVWTAEIRRDRGSYIYVRAQTKQQIIDQIDTELKKHGST